MSPSSSPDTCDNQLPCLAPRKEMVAPVFQPPPGACDTHAHIIGDGVAYPFVANRSYTPPPATEEDYLAMLQACGISRGVLVQVSVHGTDNRYLLETLKRHQDRLRGVVVIDNGISDTALHDMHVAGVRGVRFNVLFGGGVGFDQMERICERIAPLGWHAQFLMDVRRLPELYPRMARLPVPCVFDHMGHMPVFEGMQHPGFTLLQQGLREHGWWTKLSGAYRVSDQRDVYSEVTLWAQRLIHTAPDRVVWGSDWPHVGVAHMPDTVALLNLLGQWAPDAATRRRILVDNPQRLYDFPAA